MELTKSTSNQILSFPALSEIPISCETMMIRDFVSHEPDLCHLSDFTVLMKSLRGPRSGSNAKKSVLSKREGKNEGDHTPGP